MKKISASAFEDDVKALRAAGVDWYKTNLQGTRARSPDLGEVAFTTVGRKKYFSNASVPDKIRLVTALKDIIEKGTLQETVPAAAGRKDGFVKFHWVTARVSFPDGEKAVGVTIAEDRDGNRFYNLNEDVEGFVKGRSPMPGRNANPGTSETVNQSIQEAGDGVNIYILPQGEGEAGPGPRVRGDDGSGGGAVSFHWLTAPVTIGPETVTVGVTVMEDMNGNKFYNLNEDIAAWKERNEGRKQSLQPKEGETDPLFQSIPEDGDGVNIYILPQGEGEAVPGPRIRGDDG